MIPLGSFAPTYNSETWTEVAAIDDEDTGTAFDLSTSLIEMEVRDQNGCRRLYGSTADGKLVVIDDEGFEFTFTAAEMSTLCAGSYNVFIRLTDSITGISETWGGALPVLDGGFSP